jgi:hypothetical protein
VLLKSFDLTIISVSFVGLEVDFLALSLDFNFIRLFAVLLKPSRL